MKDVLINIKGTQGIDDNIDTIELTTVGKLDIDNGDFLLSYDEDDMAGFGNVKTDLRVKPDGMVMFERTGGIESRLNIQPGVRNSCFYSTPHGDIVIGIFGESIDNSLTENGGKLTMSYTIDSDLRLISRNTLEITVKEVKNNV